jgi:hypothetical protein
VLVFSPDATERYHYQRETAVLTNGALAAIVRFGTSRHIALQRMLRIFVLLDSTAEVASGSLDFDIDA